MILRSLGLIFCIICSISCSNAQFVDLEDRRELFLDYHIVEEYVNSSIKMHSPVDRGIAFHFDKPWEGESCAYVSIIKDGELYRAYYRGKLASLSKTDKKARQITCIAESRNGIDWYKPELNIYQIGNGHDKNNIILLDEGDVSHNFSPFIDSNPDSPFKAKYKGIGGKETKGLFLYYSNDGIIWKKANENPFYTDGDFDSQNVMFWSPKHKTYLLFFRKWINVSNNKYRTIGMTSSKDLRNWSKYKLLNFGDTPIENLYTNQIGSYYRAPHILIGIGGRLFQNKKVVPNSILKKMKINPSYTNDCSDIYLISSRDGINFDRTFMESFIRPGMGYNNWTSRTNFPALNIVETSKEELSIYVHENYMQPSAYLRRFAIRIDGFTSINAGYKGGTLLTKSIKFKGKNLEINFSTSAAGGIEIELLDENNKIIDGFAKSDCDYIVGDEISRIVTWNGKNDLSSLKGSIVKMKFYLKDADVFSFKFN